MQTQTLAEYDIALAMEWEEQHKKMVTAFSKIFPVSYLKIIDKRIADFKKMLENEYGVYADMNKKGKSFQERSDSRKRIEACLGLISRYEAKRKEKIPAFETVLQWGDYEKVKRMGFIGFLEMYLV